jgi:hypothetical protein
MAIVNKVEKRIKVNKDNVVKYQIITFCFLNDIQISSSDLECLTLLARVGSYDLTKFCKLVSDKEIFKSPQSVRNAVQKAKKKNLVVKDNKEIIINPDMKVQTDGSIFLDFKILGVDEY